MLQPVGKPKKLLECFLTVFFVIQATTGLRGSVKLGPHYAGPVHTLSQTDYYLNSANRKQITCPETFSGLTPEPRFLL